MIVFLQMIVIQTGILFLLVGCATSQETMDARLPVLSNATNIVAEQSAAYLREQETLRKKLEKTAPPKASTNPVVPAYDPLDDVLVTLDVDNGDIQFVLQALANQAGINLLVHPNLAQTPHKISVHFFRVPASTVLAQVLKVADLSGKVQGNILVVTPLEERIFHLDFLELNQKTHYSTGGDVLGSNQIVTLSSSGTGSSSNTLSGNFKIDGSTPRSSNPYEALREMLDRLIGTPSIESAGDVSSASSVAEVGQLANVATAKQSDTPLYTLNRMTGTLFVRAKPSVVDTVGRLVQRFKEVLGRQILVEAQILEVSLNDDFQYGIDWSLLNRRMTSAFGATGMELGGTEGLIPELEQGHRSITVPGQVLEALGRSFSSFTYTGPEFAAAISLLQGYGKVKVLSNPTIRSKHGQASLISVGTSNSFISQSGSTAFSGTGVTVTQQIETSTVFDGLVLGLIPFIADDGIISLSIHPIQSNVDPASLSLVSIGDTAVTLPRVDLKEISTQLSLHDGDVVILGGLIDKAQAETNEQAPGISRVPVLGYLFKKEAKRNRVRELVIILKVSVR